MFYAISQIEQAVHRPEKMRNPKNPHNPMILRVFRNKVRTAFFTIYAKKAGGEFWDDTEQKKIGRRHWTSEMKVFEKQKVAKAPKPSFIFKFTIVGWIFLAFFIGLFIFIIYDSTKPPLPKSEQAVAMEKTPAEGDIYFGKYEIYKEKGNPLGAEIRFGWFKVAKVENNEYHIAKSTEMNRGYKPKEQLNNTDFEVQSMPPVKITEQTGYNISFKSDDGLTEIYITDKK